MAILVLSACGPDRIGSSGASSDDDTGSLDESTTTESTTTSPGETETGDPDPTDTVFIEPGDYCGGGFRCSVVCDVFAQDCPEGEKCSPYAVSSDLWDSKRCVPVLGDVAPGEPCSYDGREAATDDCDATSMCYGGICQPYCSGSEEDPSCPPGLGCAGTIDDPLALCLALCDPLAQDCEIGSCYWHHQHFLCNPTGDFPIGEPCGYYVDDCIPGSACVDGAALPSCLGSACCSPLCSLDQPDCASFPGTECVAWYEPGQAPAGLELVGVCVSP